MAESIARPWIAKHLLQIAETRGANIHDAPPETKKRKIQITKFLTFPPNHQPNDIIWAFISDKQYEIPVKFTAAAVTAYNRINDVFGAADDERRLTTQRYAVAVVGDIKAFFARVPIGNGKGMTVDECIAFEIGEVRVLGSGHEGIFGNPANIETHEDIQEWVSGLRQGGGAGNVLKRERTQDVPTKPAVQQQNISLQEHSAVPMKETTVLKSSAVANLPPRKEGQSKTPSDKFKAYLRKWKEVERINSIPRPISEELQAQFDQILRFGQKIRGGEKREPPILAYEKQTSENAYDGDGDRQQDGTVIEQAADSRGEVVTKPETTAPCEAKISEHEEVVNDSQESGPHQSTPSEWEDSEDERPEPKGERGEEVADSIAARQQSQRREHSGSEYSPSERDETSVEEDSEDMEDVIDESADEQSRDSDEGEEHSDRSDEENSAEWFPGPTPAQRRKQTFGTADSSPSRPHIPSQPEPSQNGASELPSSLPIAAFPYHTSSKRPSDRSGIILPLATSQLTQSQPEGPQSSHLPPDKSIPSQEKSEGAPRILVPDSDTSGAQNSQSQSQSQSQRQINTRSQFLPQSNDSHPSQHLHAPSSDRVPENTTSSAINATDQAERRLLAQSRSLTQPPKGTLTSHNKSQTASRMTSSQPQNNEATESRTQSETQPSHEEVISMPKQATAMPVEITDNAIPQPQSGEQPSSVTQDDSQTIQSHTRSSNEIQESVPVTQDPAEPETLASLDADDARTLALVFGSSTDDSKLLPTDKDLDDPFTEPQKNGESSRQTSERDVVQPDASNEHNAKRTARESFRLSRIQGSPSAHLGKHPRSSSPDLHSASLSSSATKEREASHGRKKARISSSANSAARKVAKPPVSHDSEAWKAPTFQQKRERERRLVVQSRHGEDQDAPMASVDTNRNKEKGKQRAVEPEPTLQSTGTSVATGTSAAGPQNHESRSLGSSQTISTGNATRTEQLSKAKHEQDGSHISAVPSTSSVKPRGSGTRPDKRSRLGGFTVDLAVRNRHPSVQSRNGEDQGAPAISMDTSRSKAKGKQRAVEPEPSLPSTGESVTAKTFTTASQDLGDRRLDSSQTISSSYTTRTERGGSHVSSALPSTSNVKPRGSGTKSDKRPRLGGFTVDLTPRNEPGGPRWLTWADAVQILRRIAEQREEQG
ncbi:uncharacterized protein FOMMEDRAFT_168019 [Fomitiporia mediterranea MF3/22]|uniref:uncharacterized protein n=1 Tax=Fomitiporia mediterranea (strain MF3/22) TaxID=694068 RepID=UPI0004409783|nr:uncharacterized protein FOMMEDRAFT_168019 [Fomitiporia mediterranea MF3/22]EJD02905.1 hypothetical protein FOMMEDRAFT_168019 [Fomitiporia mediterranea MF3/22]